MIATSLVEMNQLADTLRNENLGLTAEVTALPSGAAVLDVHHNGRAVVMARSSAGRFGVDVLRAGDGFGTGYQRTFEDFTAAAQELRLLLNDGVGSPVPPTLSLLVLQARDVESAKDFYSRLGLSFIAEQHGAGPRHYSATIGQLVFEIYPRRTDVPSTPQRVGFRIPSLDETVETLRRRGTLVVTEPKPSAWGRRAVVEDPDGNRVELSQ